MTKKNSKQRVKRDRELFNKISNIYSTKDLHPPSRLARYQRVRDTLLHIPSLKRGRYLEVGCGAGYASDYLVGMFDDFTGIDYSEELIKKAKSRACSDNIHFEVADFLTYEPRERYDVIFTVGVLHHMPEYTTAVKKCLSILKPGGWLAVNEPQPDNPLIQTLRNVRTKIDRTYSEEQEPIAGNILFNTFKDAGFSSVEAFPQGFFSTPFAEVALKPIFLMSFFSRVMCSVDRRIEASFPIMFRKLSWNVVLIGRK